MFKILMKISGQVIFLSPIHPMRGWQKISYICTKWRKKIHRINANNLNTLKIINFSVVDATKSKIKNLEMLSIQKK